MNGTSPNGGGCLCERNRRLYGMVITPAYIFTPRNYSRPLRFKAQNMAAVRHAKSRACDSALCAGEEGARVIGRIFALCRVPARLENQAPYLCAESLRRIVGRLRRKIQTMGPSAASKLTSPKEKPDASLVPPPGFRVCGNGDNPHNSPAPRQSKHSVLNRELWTSLAYGEYH